MLDFMKVSTRQCKKGIEVYPEFVIKKTKDLMIRGGDFYAIWDEDNQTWSTDSYRAVELMDNEIREFTEDFKTKTDERVYPLYLHNSSTKLIDTWNHYVTSQVKDNYHQLDESIVFSNTEADRKNYSSHHLEYPFQDGSREAYEELMGTLYDEEEKHKLEWAIGAIVSGDSKKIQKFIVLYGSGGTGKSTFLNIVQMLFDGYYAVFDAKALGSLNATFALESFRSNPLVAIQHDGDLSRIEDNTRLNSLVSHEKMEVNEKYKSSYTSQFNSFCFMGTNKPVKITDAKSGIIRRLIDVNPSGRKVSMSKYKQLYSQIKFELSGIAWHCLEVYESDPGYYDNYIPISMIGASNDFFNFIDDSYEVFKKAGHTTLAIAWPMYNDYCTMAKVPYPYSMRAFKEELKNYFKTFVDRGYDEKGERVRNYYDGFLADKFDYIQTNDKEAKPSLRFEYSESLLDHVIGTQPAQYAGEDEKPHIKWNAVTTKLEDLDTRKLHYVKMPSKNIVIDFDLKDKDGNKSFALNLEAASHFPLTYAELSKSGQGIHLHYIWDGDPSQLSSLYDEDIEIKVFKGNASLRRKVSLCNNIPVKTISTGLPLKGEKKLIDFEGFENDKHLRRCILKALRKEVFPNTRPSVDYIHHCLETAYKQGLKYDCSDMHSAVLGFAAESSHQADYCLRKVADMKFKSEEPSAAVESDKDGIIFFDIEVYPNLLLVCYKAAGKDKPCVRLFNPTPEQIEKLSHYKLIGYNCRRYDNHILYARLLGYNNQQIYELSSKIIDAEKKAGMDSGFFAEAYNFSYTDVFDYASAPNKQSLKKYEIQLGIPHQEMDLDWNQPVPEELWDKVADYCCNDVIATEAVHEYLSEDFNARKILAEMAGKSVNTSTNTLTSTIIFGNNRSPQSEFFYRDLSKPVKKEDLPPDVLAYYEKSYNDKLKVPFSEESYLPYFPGYKYDPLAPKGKRSAYKGQDVGEGGWVYAKPGMYENVALLDIASMHPHSLMAECSFGPRYTLRFKGIVDTRLYIKHDDLESCKTVLDGLIAPFLESTDISPKKLSTALKTPINAVYGLSSASFDNPCRDPRNKDNIVAKRGALFMVDLKEAVESQGYTVAHIKTDSIKIPNADDKIIKFVMDFGKRYGYTFEHEATYERMCLINDSTYIARYQDGHWDAVAAQFAEPYVFKTCFSHEPLEFKDYCQTKSVKTTIFLQDGDKLKFVGKVGSFIPMTQHGAKLVAQRLDKDGNVKYDSVTGCKDYLWSESADVVENHWEEFIDMSYYRDLVDKAREAISEYGDYEAFASGEPLIPVWLKIPDDAPDSGVIFS